MRRKANLNLEECLSILDLISGMVVIDKDGLIKYLSPDMEERIRRFGDVQEDAEFIGSSILLNILVRWNRTSGNLEIRCPGSGNHRMRVYSRNSLAKPYTSRIEISCSASMLVILIR